MIRQMLIRNSLATFYLLFCSISYAASNNVIDIIEKIPASQRTERLVTCLGFLRDNSLDEQIRIALIDLFAKDVQYVSPHYGCNCIDIDEHEWIRILSDGVDYDPNNMEVVYALTQLLINTKQYEKALEVISPYAYSHPSSHESTAWLEYTTTMMNPGDNETRDMLVFDVHFCVITANHLAHEKATWAQLHEEVAILNRRFVTLDGNPLVEFRFKSASFYDDVKDLSCPFVALGDSLDPYNSGDWATLFNECSHPAVRDRHAINFYIFDAYSESSGFSSVTSHGKRNSNRPYVLIDWARLNNTGQSSEVHEMGHSFGLGHIGVPGATISTHTNIMCSAELNYGSGGRRNLGFTEAQSAIILYHAKRTHSRLK